MSESASSDTTAPAGDNVTAAAADTSAADTSAATEDGEQEVSSQQNKKLKVCRNG